MSMTPQILKDTKSGMEKALEASKREFSGSADAHHASLRETRTLARQHEGHGRPLVQASRLGR